VHFYVGRTARNRQAGSKIIDAVVHSLPPSARRCVT
jgi:hypothetical protein